MPAALLLRLSRWYFQATTAREIDTWERARRRGRLYAGECLDDVWRGRMAVAVAVAVVRYVGEVESRS